VRDARTRDPQQWEFILQRGQTWVYPNDDAKAPPFQLNGTYTVQWSQPEHSYGRVETGAFLSARDARWADFPRASPRLHRTGLWDHG